MLHGALLADGASGLIQTDSDSDIAVLYIVNGGGVHQLIGLAADGDGVALLEVVGKGNFVADILIHALDSLGIIDCNFRGLINGHSAAAILLGAIALEADAQQLGASGTCCAGLEDIGGIRLGSACLKPDLGGDNLVVDFLIERSGSPFSSVSSHGDRLGLLRTSFVNIADVEGETICF